MASRRRSGAQNQPLQSRRPEQIEAFQPFHHVRPLIYQHVVEFDFADAWATILPVAISCYCLSLRGRLRPWPFVLGLENPKERHDLLFTVRIGQ